MRDDGDGNEGYLDPSLTDDIRSAIAEDMAKNGPEQKPGALSSSTPLVVSDLMSQFGHLLNDETKKAMSTASTSMMKVEDDHTISQVRFLGKRTTVDNIDLAAKIVCENLNELAASNFIKGSLLSLSKLDFAPAENNELAVLSYVMLSSEGVEFFDDNFQDIKVEQGQMPSEISGI